MLKVIVIHLFIPVWNPHWVSGCEKHWIFLISDTDWEFMPTRHLWHRTTKRPTDTVAATIILRIQFGKVTNIFDLLINAFIIHTLILACVMKLDIHFGFPILPLIWALCGGKLEAAVKWNHSTHSMWTSSMSYPSVICAWAWTCMMAFCGQIQHSCPTASL